MADRRVGGILYLKVDGEVYDAKGEFTYDLGLPKREAVVGADKTHGYKETPKVAYVEGAITDRKDLDAEKLRKIKDATVTLELANGKVVVIREAWEASDGTGTTEEGELEVRFEGMQGEEIR